MAYLDHTFHGKARPVYSDGYHTLDDIGVEEEVMGSFAVIEVMYDEDKGEGQIICNGECPCKDWLVVMEDYGDNLKRVVDDEVAPTGQNWQAS